MNEEPVGSKADPEKYFIHKSVRQENSCFCSQKFDEGKYYKRLSGEYESLAKCNEAIRKNCDCTKDC